MRAAKTTDFSDYWLGERGGVEHFLHSHVSEEPGELDSDGLDRVFDRPTLEFGRSLARYRDAIPAERADLRNADPELVEFAARALQESHLRAKLGYSVD